MRRQVATAVALMFCGCCASALGQANSWTNGASGNWEDPSWSNGSLPGDSQSIYITNAGWKAVMIWSTTVQTHAESLSVNSITVSSPSDSFNTLLLNYAGLTKPLTANSITVGNNAAITMHSSALQITGLNGVGLSVGGEFNQGDGSVVSGGWINVGVSGSGLYHFTSGHLNVNHVFIDEQGSLIQDGGTNNSGEIHLGGYAGSGSYTLSNGVVNVSTISAEAYGSFTQWRGTTIVNGPVSLSGGFVDRNLIAYGSFALQRGFMSCSAINMDTGSYSQGNATNVVAGDITLATATHSFFYVNGGELRSANVTINDAWVGGFFQGGGVNVITNQLSIAGNGLPGWSGFVLSGGDLNVRDIVLNPRGQFTWNGGNLKQTSSVTMIGGKLTLGSGIRQFGQLRLGADNSFAGSSLELPAGNNCIARFAASSGITWSNAATLTISNWSGSVTGGGMHQVIFGSNSTALTEQQIARIVFANPSGLPAGTYAGRILSSGEVVPGTTSPASSGLTMLSLTKAGDGSIQLQVHGVVGGNYRIEVSTNMSTWTTWTNQQAKEETMLITDEDSSKHPLRFYRGILEK